MVKPVPFSLFTIEIDWFCCSPIISPLIFKAPAVFVILAIPLRFVIVPEISSPLVPEFVTSRVLPEFVTLPFISNTLLVFVKSVSPFVLVTLPSSINPPFPLLFIERAAPLLITSAPK